ncbi:hypothetical protein ACFVTY_06965 [Streptomyces sp. NPDC058067]
MGTSREQVWGTPEHWVTVFKERITAVAALLFTGICPPASN